MRTLRDIRAGHGAWIIAAMLSTGCATTPPAPPAVAPVVVEPLQLHDATFKVRGTRFAKGLAAVVELCVSTAGQISGATVLRSSGEPRFDEFALQWAQRIRVEPRREDGRAVASCNSVRVEMNRTPLMPTGGGLDNALG